jgi:hypothetical protein
MRRRGAEAAFLAGDSVQGIRLVHHGLRQEILVRRHHERVRFLDRFGLEHVAGARVDVRQQRDVFFELGFGFLGFRRRRVELQLRLVTVALPYDARPRTVRCR